MKTVPPEEALRAIGVGRRIAASPGCGAPTALLEALGHNSELVAGSSLYSGLLLDDYPFLPAVEAGLISYGTWHVMQPVRSLVADGTVSFYPVRGSQVGSLIRALGVDTALIRVTPPDRYGYCSLGPSASYSAELVRNAALVVAEIDTSLPRVSGDTAVHVSQIDVAIESTSTMPVYRAAEPTEESRAIARHIATLLPPSPTIQAGIGGVTEALVAELAALGVEDLRFVGMANDYMVALAEAGALSQRVAPYPPITAAELMGSRALMDFADENPQVGNFGAATAIDPASVSRFDRFVAINSAVQVDLMGQVNAEWAGGHQLTGVGGSIDFFEAAARSSGGLGIVALSAMNVRHASSRIVRSLPRGAPVTVPRHLIDYVVTEFGIADLAAASVTERAERLAAIAHPDHRDEVLATSQ